MMKKTKIMENRWLSVEEICEHLGVKKDTIYSFIKDKDMPAYKVGRSWKFKAREVDIWVEEGRAGE
jgi:excisionase family DNA binding protein